MISLSKNVIIFEDRAQKDWSPFQVSASLIILTLTKKHYDHSLILHLTNTLLDQKSYY